jgi:hypothetical protein
MIQQDRSMAQRIWQRIQCFFLGHKYRSSTPSLWGVHEWCDRCDWERWP